VSRFGYWQCLIRPIDELGTVSFGGMAISLEI